MSNEKCAMPKLFPGEAEAIAATLKDGHEYGFGNLIHHLKVEWCKLLMREHGVREDSARLGAGLECVDCVILRRQLAGPPQCGCGKKLEPAPGELGRWSPCDACLELVAEGAAEAAAEAKEPDHTREAAEATKKAEAAHGG